MKTCSACHVGVARSPTGGYCLPCHRSYMDLRRAMENTPDLDELVMSIERTVRRAYAAGVIAGMRGSDTERASAALDEAIRVAKEGVSDAE